MPKKFGNNIAKNVSRLKTLSGHIKSPRGRKAASKKTIKKR